MSANVMNPSRASQSSPTILHQLAARAASQPLGVAVRQKRLGIWHVATWRDCWRMAGECALGLQSVGISAGDRVAILCSNRQEWVISYFGILLAGAVPAGLYVATTPEGLAEQLGIARPVAVICENLEQFDKVVAAGTVMPSAKATIVCDMRGVNAAAGVTSFDDLMQAGAAALRDRISAADELLDKVRPEGLALVALTTGTGGEAKSGDSVHGRKTVEMTHAKLNALLDGLLSVEKFDASDEVLSYLPLAHPTELLFSLFLPVGVGATVNFPESQRSMQDDIREIAPTVFLAVPRVWEGLHREVIVRRGQTGRVRRWLFDRILAAASGRGGRAPSAMHRFLMLEGLQDFLGLTRARFLGTAGAMVAPEALSFFRGIGLPLRNVYSLVEAGGLTAIGAIDEGSDALGSILPALEHRIGADGMLELRARSAGAADGWFASGDIVENRDGRLYLLGRVGDLIDTGMGTIHPSSIERVLKSSLFIREALVVQGEGRQLIALVQLDFATVGEWAKLQQVSFTTFASLAANPVVSDLIAGAVRDLNPALPPQQRVAGFVLLQQELDAGKDELTPLLTVRRNVIRARHAQRLAAAIPV
jgi:long-chain acyl-CoA synthetase